jgi:Ca2+-binding RTX toxin-like protein
MYGDAGTMSDDAEGGNDRLVGGTTADRMWGDAVTMSGRSQGGDDRLSGGDDDDVMYGDGQVMSSTAQGGNDVLSGDRGNDQMWGGKGFDRFVFRTGDGIDRIEDFDPHSGGADADVVDLRGMGIASFAALMSLTADDTNGDAVITFSASQRITFIDVAKADFSAPDFLL